MYRKFRSTKEAIEWGKDHYGYWLPNYQPEGALRGYFGTENLEALLLGEYTQMEVKKLKEEAMEYRWLSYYCGGNYGLAINQKLRYGYTIYEFPEKNLMEMQQVMDTCLERWVIPEDIWGYRFLEYEDLCKSTKRKYINCGAIIEDKGYMGVGLVESALGEEFGAHNTLLKIMIPKGTKGLYIDLISNRGNEQEVLFARGSKLMVVFCYRRISRRVIICKVIN